MLIIGFGMFLQAASEVKSEAMDVAESRSAVEEPHEDEEEKESRSLENKSSSSNLDPVTKELKSQLPLHDGAEKASGYLDLLSNRQKPLPRRVREKLQSRRARPTPDPTK